MPCPVRVHEANGRGDLPMVQRMTWGVFAAAYYGDLCARYETGS